MSHPGDIQSFPATIGVRSKIGSVYLTYEFDRRRLVTKLTPDQAVELGRWLIEVAERDMAYPDRQREFGPLPTIRQKKGWNDAQPKR